MVVVPAAIPVTRPVPEPTIATLVLLLVQTPPEIASLSVIEVLGQILVTPVIAPGATLTVKTDPDPQPVNE